MTRTTQITLWQRWVFLASIGFGGSLAIAAWRLSEYFAYLEAAARV